MEFLPIDPRIVKHTSPNYYHPEADFYALTQGGENVGLFGIKRLTKDVCELEILVFTEFRHKVLTKAKCQQLLDFVQKRYRNVIIGTKLKSLQKLCKAFKFREFCQTGDKVWFIKEM